MSRRIYFNARFLTQPASGMQRYAHQMLTALDAQVSQHAALRSAELVALAPRLPLRPTAWRSIRVEQCGRLQGHAWEQFELPWRARDSVLISLAGSGPLLHRNHVLALHDANVFAHPEFYTRRYGAWHRTLRPWLARAATSLVTVSEFSRRELAHHCGVNPRKFVVLPDSADHILDIRSDDRILARWDLRPGRYALTVGNQSPNKNVALAVAAFARAAVPGAELAVVGVAAGQVLKSAALPCHAAVKQLGRVTDGELRALYEHATVLLFPSVYEGFGVPPLEALSLGCPVIASPRAAVPEVLENAASYFTDVDDFANKVRDAFADSPAQRVAADFERVLAKYSWQRSAAGLAKLLSPAV